MTKSTESPVRRTEKSPFSKEEREGVFIPLETARKRRNTGKFKNQDEIK
ncbi:hypothetical protein [Aeromonas sp. MrichA-1]|nr:hypothetical protein [Aeromonas sp. MrichA-1]MBP4081928.1 hypothetical protein [Aeromonas sp. MrichA-1]